MTQPFESVNLDGVHALRRLRRRGRKSGGHEERAASTLESSLRRAFHITRADWLSAWDKPLTALKHASSMFKTSGTNTRGIHRVVLLFRCAVLTTLCAQPKPAKGFSSKWHGSRSQATMTSTVYITVQQHPVCEAADQMPGDSWLRLYVPRLGPDPN